MSAVPAAGQAAEQPRLRRLELVAASDGLQTPAEVWVALGAGALVLPFWALVGVVPLVHVAGLVARREVSWSRWLPAVSLVAAAAAGLAAGGVLRAVEGDGRLPLAGVAAAATGIATHRLLVERSFRGLEADAVAVAVGVVVGALWRLNPLMIPMPPCRRC
jgi:hypothetical protein